MTRNIISYIGLIAMEGNHLFMGDGLHSAGECYEKIIELQKAYSNLSALQQGADNKVEIEYENWLLAVGIFESITGCRISRSKPPLHDFEVGELVEITGDDSYYKGWISVIFPKRSGKLRCVVENADGQLHVYNLKQLVRLEDASHAQT